MDSLINLSRNILQRIGAVNARLLGILRISYEQMLALFAWPLMRNRNVSRLQILPKAVSPSFVTDEYDQDEPDTEYSNVRREAAISSQQLLAAIIAWKQTEKNLSDALRAGKRLTFSAYDEVRELEIANNAAEDVMLDAIRDRTKIHMEHCDKCQRIIDASRTKMQVVRRVSHEKIAVEVTDSPRKLLAITYGDDKADEEIAHKLNRCDILTLPAPEVYQKVIELPPCQVENRSIKANSRSLKKKLPQPKPRWR